MKYIGNQPSIEIVQTYSDKWDFINSGDPATTSNPSSVYATWLNITNGNVFVCTDNTEDANVWILFSTTAWVNTQTGTTYTLVASDAGKLVTLSNAAAITLTIPANSSVPFPVGTIVNLLALGAGTVSVAITTDTLVSKGSATDITGQYSAATLVKTGSTTWCLFGDIS